jgi:site-specific DNA-methyltransferase (adenine-specific)
MRNKRNKYDKRDCLEIGHKAEDVFARIADQKGWKVTTASNYANINDHWDVLIEKEAERYRVDVKGMKRLSRSDPDVQDEWIWIELHGVREHDRGWLYDGKAELVAFEKKREFVVVKRDDLIKLIEQLVDLKTTVHSAKAARYKIYSRPGRPDRITLIETEKLKPIKWDEWAKSSGDSLTESPGNDNLYFGADSVFIYHDDFLTTECVEGNSIDLIVTSPPYNVDIKYGSYNDDISYEVYLEFTREWLTRCLKLAKDDGRFCLNIPLDKNKGGQQSVCADITTIAKQVGWKYHSTIIWNEQNISRRTAWGSWLSASAPYVIAPVEVIVVLYKKRWKKMGGSKQSDVSREEFMEWTNGVWNFSGESKKRVGHPAPFPVELPKRCIKLFTFVGDTVLDPFLGSGSTLVACAETNRKGIGLEMDSHYCEIAKQRLIAEGRITQRRLIEPDKHE